MNFLKSELSEKSNMLYTWVIISFKLLLNNLVFILSRRILRSTISTSNSFSEVYTLEVGTKFTNFSFDSSSSKSIPNPHILRRTIMKFL